MVTYEWAQHSTSGETYALKRRGGVIVGVFGPVYYRSLNSITLEWLDYDYDDADWAAEQEWVNVA